MTNCADNSGSPSEVLRSAAQHLRQHHAELNWAALAPLVADWLEAEASIIADNVGGEAAGKFKELLDSFGNGQSEIVLTVDTSGPAVALSEAVLALRAAGGMAGPR